jgi:hypothetical protein
MPKMAYRQLYLTRFSGAGDLKVFDNLRPPQKVEIRAGEKTPDWGLLFVSPFRISFDYPD